MSYLSLLLCLQDIYKTVLLVDWTGTTCLKYHYFMRLILGDTQEFDIFYDSKRQIRGLKGKALPRSRV